MAKKATIKITSDTKEAESGLDKVSAKINQFSNNNKQSLGGLSRLNGAITNAAKSFGAVGVAAGAAVAVVKKVNAVIKETTDLYKVQANAERALEVAAKNNPYLNDTSVIQLKNYASELQAVSTVGDEQLIPMMAQLAAAGRNQAEIQQIMSAALDVSASGMMSLDAAVTALNKTYSGTAGQLGNQITAIKEAGIKNVMALRGDLTPELEKTDRSKWDYQYAVQLIRELKENDGDFCIGAACYPEIHPESANQKEDIIHLKEKVDAGADFLTTQMVFDNNLFFNFMYKLREAGVTVPVIPGIMPITNAVQVEKAIKLSGSFMPQKFKSIVDYFGQDPTSMKQAGIIYATSQIIDLYANGITNVHVYSMNKPDVAKAIMDNLSDILGKDFNR